MGISGRLSKKAGQIKHLGRHRDWENYRDLLMVLVQKELKVRYNNKVLGYLWSIANPLAHSAIYFVSFRVFMEIRIPDYPLVLISGIFPWQWLSNSIGGSTHIFTGNVTLMKKGNFPGYILPLAEELNHTLHFIFSIPVIVLLLLIFGIKPNHTWLYGLPILLINQFLMSYGISLALASVNVFLRDLERLVHILLHFVFYATPIIYPIDKIPEIYKKFVFLNPFAPLILSWRDMILKGTLQHSYLLVSFIYAVICFAIGCYIYRKLWWKFAEVI